ncbi:MAG TPA: hypothetical protein VFZ58_00815 [Candidatus Saccharimonadales bacterium]
MSELQLRPAQLEEITAVTTMGIGRVDQKYGVNHMQHEGSETPLEYHNGRHTRNVIKNTGILAVALEMPKEEQKIAEAAAGWHDVEQLEGSGINEAESITQFEAAMRKHTTAPEELICMGSMAIEGTLPIFKNGIIVHQKAIELDFPTKSAERIAKSVSSGDLGELYRPNGPLDGHLLYQEITRETEPSLEGLLEFQRKNLALLDGTYRYPLKEAYDVLATHRREVIRYSEHVLKQLEAGQIDSLQQLLANDEQFMKDPSPFATRTL